MSYRFLIFIISVSLSLPAYPRGVNIDSIGQALSGCWRWDYYGGGIAGLPPTPAWDDIRLEFSRDAQDSLNGTISFLTYADTVAVDSGRTSVWIDSNYLAWFVMDDVLARAFGLSFPPFPPIYFQDNHGAIEFTHFDISDDFYYGFVRDTCLPDTPLDKVDSVIALLKGCWHFDFYGGGLAGLPPTPTGGNAWLKLDQDAQDSLNQTISFWNYNNGVAIDSGRATLNILGGGLFNNYSFMPDILGGPYNFIYAEHYHDTLIFTHAFPDEFYGGYVKDSCSEIIPPDTTIHSDIDSIIEQLEGCWRLDYYFGGIANLPPTPATTDERWKFIQVTQDSVLYWIYVDSVLVDSSGAIVRLDTAIHGIYYTLRDPILFLLNNDTLILTHQGYDPLFSVYVRDSCINFTPPPDTTAENIDSIIDILNGCWQWDHYFGGFPQIPPTPAWSDVKIEFSQNTLDSLNHTVTGESYLNDTLEFSGTCNVVADTNNIGYYTLSCGLFDSIGIVGWPPLIFNFEGDTLLFPQQSYVDGYVYGFLKGCEDDTIIDVTKLPEDIEVYIYPNPASDKIVIEVENDQRVRILLYNVIGKRLEEYQDVRNKMEVDISNIPDGIYFIMIEMENELLSRKLIISR